MIHYKNHYKTLFDLSSFCLDSELYEKKHNNSAFLRLFNGEKSMSLLPVDGFETVIAFDENRPIGLAIVEYIKDPYRISLKNKSFNINKNISIYTNIGVYVKDKYRNKGVGAELIKKVCQEAYQRRGQYLKDIPGMSASGIGEIIAGQVRNNPYHFIFNCPVKCYATENTYKSIYTSNIVNIFHCKDSTNRIFSQDIQNNISISLNKKKKYKK